jgi:MFS family permease
MPQWSLTDNSETPGAVGQSSKQENGTATPSSEILGIPISLMPYYVAFMLDAIAIGLVMPVLPFTIIELGASALQLSLVVSANYIAQSLGVILMGRISDYYGRKIVMLVCLGASAASYVSLSNSYSLLGIALSRIISGSFGGLLPVMQSAVADVASPIDRPKYLGRIVAVFGLGFVIGPAFSSLMSSYRTRQKILVAAALPFIGWLIIYFFGRETKQVFITQSTAMAASSVHSTPKVCKLPTTSKTGRPTSHSPQAVSFDVMLLVINGFCIMYAFATETIYAMFMKDIFGYGEDSLSLLFASNGVFIGIFQVFFIKPLIVRLGKHATLAFGSMLLSIGMCGFALIRHQVIHFVLFTIHIIGYSIADTTLASLISTYSSAMNQGRNLSYNQAAQSCARVVGPLLAGFLYEYDKDIAKPTSPASTVLIQSSSPVMLPLMPQGSLPFVAGAMLPAFAVFIPLYLYMKEMPLKRKIGGEIDLESKCGDVDYYD